MKILLITSEIGETGGGLSVACSRFFDMLTHIFHYEVDVVSSTKQVIKTATGGYNPSLENKLGNEIRLKSFASQYAKQGINIVIAFGGSFNGFFGALLAKKLNTRFILMLRGTDINLAKWDAQEQFFLLESTKRAEIITCLSDEMKDNVSMMTDFPHNDIVVIPNSMREPSLDTKNPTKNNLLKFGTGAAHVNEKKGIENLLYTIYELKLICKNKIILEIVGSIDEDLLKNYEETVKALDLEQNIRFISYRNRTEFETLMKSWDYYIQGSVCEGYGNSVKEAIENGKAIILTPTGYFAEKLHDDYPFLIFNSFIPSEMAKTIYNIINMPDATNQYRNAYDMLYKDLNESKLEKEWRKVIEKDIHCNNKKNTLSKNIILSLYLHDVIGNVHDHITTPIKVLEKFLTDLSNKGYQLCSMNNFLKCDSHVREKSIVCTFDDGYSSLCENVLPLFEKYGFSATVFINTSLIGQDNSWNWKDSVVRKHLDLKGIEMIKMAGWEIGSHGHTHKNLLRLTGNEIREEFKRSKDILNQIVGNVTCYAYPYGQSSPYSRKICSEFFNYAFSLDQGGSELNIDKYQIRRYTIDDIYTILDL